MPKDVDLKFACKLKPQKVVDYFEAKGYKTSWNWNDTYQEAHTKAFTVAKCTQMDVLQDIRSAVQKAIDDGETFDEFKKKLAPTLQQKGWWGKKEVEAPDGTLQTVQLGSERRLKTIFDTNIRTSYSAGRFKELIENVEDRPIFEYNSMLLPTTRQSHAALHKKAFRYDDPFWETHWPPNAWGCVCWVRAYDLEDVEDKNIEVESSEGKLINKEVKIRKDSLDTKTVTGFRTKDKNGKEVTVYTDAGWNYNVGKVNYQTDLWAAGKLKEAPEVLQKEYLKDMVNSEWHKNSFSNWVEKTKSIDKKTGSSTIAGYLDNDVWKTIVNKYEKESLPVVVCDDGFILHATREAKKARNQAVTTDQLLQIPEILAKPDAVILDNNDPALLFVVKDDVIPDHQIKLVVKLDKLAHKIKEPLTKLTTMSTVAAKEVRHPHQEIIYGKLKE